MPFTLSEETAAEAKFALAWQLTMFPRPFIDLCPAEQMVCHRSRAKSFPRDLHRLSQNIYITSNACLPVRHRNAGKIRGQCVCHNTRSSCRGLGWLVRSRESGTVRHTPLFGSTMKLVRQAQPPNKYSGYGISSTHAVLSRGPFRRTKRTALGIVRVLKSHKRRYAWRSVSIPVSRNVPPYLFGSAGLGSGRGGRERLSIRMLSLQA